MRKKQKVIGIMKDKLDGKIMKEFVKIYSYLMDDDLVDKRAKGANKCVMKQEPEIRGPEKLTGK